MEEHYIPGTTDEIYGEREQFSFGVDSILLSAFARAKRTDEVLDLCSGNGIVALRIARLTGARSRASRFNPRFTRSLRRRRQNRDSACGRFSRRFRIWTRRTPTIS